MQLDDEDEDDLIYRRKTCPTCRAVVRSRPIPLFLMKSIMQAIAKSRLPAGQVKQRSPPIPEGDPWEGIFRPADTSSEEDLEDDGIDEDSELYDDEGEEDDDGWDVEYGYGTGSDEEPFEGQYVDARWAPPSVFLDPVHYDPEVYTVEELTLLRRGGTIAMRELFNLTYSHEDGLRMTSEGNTICLGMWRGVISCDNG
jgi:hypothetical protein